MFRWKKLGRVFNPADVVGLPWLNTFAQGPSVLVFDKFVRVYFSCRPAPDRNGQYVSHSAYVDLRRDDLFTVLGLSRKPILPLGKLGTFDEFGTYPVSVIRDGPRVLAYYAGWTRCESVPFNVAIGMAISEDNGETFHKVGDGPVLSYSLDEPFVISGPKIRRFNDTWYLFYIAGRKWIMIDGRAEPTYKIRMASSIDGYSWEKHGKDLVRSRIEPDEAQASPDVYYANGRYHMFFCYRHSANYRNASRGYRIGYASSEDLTNWTRDDKKVGIDVSPQGWDNEMISYPHVFDLDGKVYMFYLGNQVGKFGFGLARMEGRLA